MFILGGVCFICLGQINEAIIWEMPLWQQVLISAGIITGLEFATGCMVNLWFGWGVWDYSQMPGNILGQVCPQFLVMWVVLAAVGIVMLDWMRYGVEGGERPHYTLWRTHS